MSHFPLGKLYQQSTRPTRLLMRRSLGLQFARTEAILVTD